MPVTSNPNGMEAAWAGWADALVATLFPAGLGPGQHFAFGQTTLVADFANSDPQVINAEAFRIGDMVPGASPHLVPMASLNQAYGYLLEQLNSPMLAPARADWNEATSGAPNRFTMPARMGAQAPAGASTAAPGTGAPAPTTYVPAYALDNGFRTKYEEWQASSVAGRTSGGGVIRVHSSGRAATAPVPRSLRATASVRMATALPPFVRILAPAQAQAQTRALSSDAALLAPASHGAGANTNADADADADGSGYSIEVAFTGLGTFMLGPAAWFSDTAVRLFGGQLSAADQARYFGSAGVLARRMYQVVLGFEPSVSLRIGAQDAGTARALAAQPPGSAIGVGPLTFATASLTSTIRHDGSTVTIGPAASTLPILLGVVSTDLANPPPTT